MADTDAETLRRATRGVVVFFDGPLLRAVPSVAWADGAGVWLTTGQSLDRLRDDPACVLYLPPPQRGEPATVVRGPARVYGLHDPLGLALHGASVATAMSALALRGAASLLRHWPRLLPPEQVAVRVGVRSLRVVPPADGFPGVAPAVPPIVPADVRRGVSGTRDVLVVRPDAEPQPAVWSAGFALAGVPDAPLAAVVADAGGPAGRGAVGVALQGPIEHGRLRPTRACWWHDTVIAAAQIPAAPTIVLPD